MAVLREKLEGYGVDVNALLESIAPAEGGEEGEEDELT